MVRKYFIAAIILSSILFLSGFLFGYSWDLMKKNYINELIIDEKQDLDLYLLMYQVFEERSMYNDSFCSSLPHTFFYPLYSRLEDVRKDFEQVINSNFVIDEKKYNNVAKEYLKLNIRAWLLTEKYREVCNNTNTALFIYDPSSLDGMSARRILEAVKREYGVKFLLFHVDNTIKNPLTETIKAMYNITNNKPVVIINGEKIVKYPFELKDIIKNLNK